MTKNLLSAELPYRGSNVDMHVATASVPTSVLQRSPTELLLRFAEALDRTEDLQNLRLVNRAFSEAATTTLQSRFVRLHLMPTKPSMARFTRLTMNKLIAPKILQVIVVYMPPYASTVPRECARIGDLYGMSPQNVKDIVSEFNEMCAYPELADDDEEEEDYDESLPPNANVVMSGEFERVLGDGLERLPALRSVSMSSDISVRWNELWPSLNLPEYLHCGFRDSRGGLFDSIKHLTVAEYARYKILSSMFETCLGFGSPTNIVGALKKWRSDIHEHPHSLSFLIKNMGSPCEHYWMAGLANQPLLLDDCMVNITRVFVAINGSHPPLSVLADLDQSGQQHLDLALGLHWCALLQAAANLKSLRLYVLNTTSWSAGFDNLLGHIFKKCTWAGLTTLSIGRVDNIKLLPTEDMPFSYAPGWHLFLQEDLDKFLLRHKSSLESLDLNNIVGLEEQPVPPPWSLQWAGPGFPEDPTPSLHALDNSLDLWIRELSSLKEIAVVVKIDGKDFLGHSTLLDTWLPGSEVQALATTLGIEAEKSEISKALVTWNRVKFDMAESRRGPGLGETSGPRLSFASPGTCVDFM